MNSGHNTLHGGIVGWDRRNWTIVAKNQTSVTYHHLDAADEHFPGNVDVYVCADDTQKRCCILLAVHR